MKRQGTHNLRMIGVRDLRDINQTVFLHLIRERQPISRADIVKATGLQPGTVSAIVNRLIKEKLIYEGVEGPSSGGRPPKYLHVNAESAYHEESVPAEHPYRNAPETPELQASRG